MTTEESDRPTPGLKFIVWPKAFDHAVQTAVDRVFEEETLSQKYRSYTGSNDVQVTRIVRPKLSIEIQPRKLICTLHDASVTVRGQRRNSQNEENFEKRISGSFDVSIVVNPSDDSTIYSAGINSDNLRCSYSSQSNCSNSVSFHNGKFSSTFSNSLTQTSTYLSQSSNGKRSFQNVSATAYLYESSAKRSRTEVSITYNTSANNDDLGTTITRALEDAVLESLNRHLPDYSFPVGSSCDWMFDFSGLSKPEFQKRYLESTHLGAICSGEDTIMIPVQAAPFPKPRTSGRMLTIYISNYVINTIGYYLHQQNILNYNLTQADLIPQATEDSSTTETSERTGCLSDCFPDFSVKYPCASMEVNTISTEAPTAKFSGQSLKVTLLGSAIFRAHLPDGKLVDCLKAAVTMETKVHLELKMENLSGTVTSILPTSITVVESVLESVNQKVLKEVFDLIAKQFLSRKLEEITQKGIPLPCPLLSGVEEFENVEVRAADDYLRIDTDLKFNA